MGLPRPAINIRKVAMKAAMVISDTDSKWTAVYSDQHEHAHVRLDPHLTSTGCLSICQIVSLSMYGCMGSLSHASS